MSAGDIIGLVSLLVAVQGLILAVFLWVMDKKYSEHLEEVEMLRLNKFLVDKQRACLVAALSYVEAIESYQMGLLDRIAATHLTEAQRIRFRTEADLCNRRVLKTIAEASIFEERKDLRESAIRDLAEEYGDLGSLRLMEDVRRETKQGGDSALADGIDRLHKRLDGRDTGRGC